jgi:hypothetical protein
MGGLLCGLQVEAATKTGGQLCQVPKTRSNHSQQHACMTATASVVGNQVSSN